MVLKLFGSPVSTCTRRVAVVLIEKKAPFELGAVDVAKGEHKSSAFLANQPLGQNDDGFFVYESRAICRYIEDKYPNQGTKLAPSDVQGKALFEQAASVEYSNFDPFYSKAVAEMLFKLYMVQTPEKPGFDTLVIGLSAKLDAYEEVTLADLFHLPYGSMLAMAGSDLLTTKGPNVARWFNDISARASWVATKDEVKRISSY
ncbi:thioredoxin-like protein [Mycena sp. CBHHK59/15]|nr:thioredoxin-like protein [Mycena sp. CBHHK59/15]